MNNRRYERGLPNHGRDKRYRNNEHNMNYGQSNKYPGNVSGNGYDRNGSYNQHRPYSPHNQQNQYNEQNQYNQNNQYNNGHANNYTGYNRYPPQHDRQYVGHNQSNHTSYYNSNQPLSKHPYQKTGHQNHSQPYSNVTQPNVPYSRSFIGSNNDKYNTNNSNHDQFVTDDRNINQHNYAPIEHGLPKSSASVRRAPPPPPPPKINKQPPTTAGIPAKPKFESEKLKAGGITLTEPVLSPASNTTQTIPNTEKENFSLQKKLKEELELDRNIENLTRKNKITEWKKSKTPNESGIRKKTSLMKFGKKKATKLSGSLGKKPPKNAVLDDDENDDALMKLVPIPIQRNSSPAADFVSPDLDSLLVSLESKEMKKEAPINLLEDENMDGVPQDLNLNKIEEDVEKAENMMNIIDDRENEKKEIPFHEFSTQDFTKKFYIESDFIRSMTNEEVKILRENDAINIRGSNILKPILEWSQLGLPNSIFSILENLNFDSPTPIQCEALPHIMDGNDFIGIAKTGSGKTIAYLLPLFRQLLSNAINLQTNKSYMGATPRAIIITPTRELALQIANNCKPFAENLNLKVCKCYGGQSLVKQISDLKKHPDIIVGTPGRIIDLLCTNSGKLLNLSNVTYLVLDEADRMFDMGFEPQMMKILSVIRPDRQTVLFSATFPPKIQLLGRKILKNPVEVLIGNKNNVNEKILQKFEIVESDEAKFSKLLQVLGQNHNESAQEDHKILIFMERQDSCDKMVKKLIGRGYAVMALHGGKDQIERDGTIKDFQQGIINMIVATSIASRGLDVENLNLVINYDPPSHIEDYVHRVGRTGRGGNSGESVTILTPDQEKCASDLVRVLKSSNHAIPEDLKKMASSFEEKIKTGDVKFSSGFGGKGLEKLQAIRERNENLEKNAYLKDENDDENGTTKNKASAKLSEDDQLIESAGSIVKNIMMSYRVEEKVTNDGKISYFATLLINDLPNDTRWAVTTRQTYDAIIELTGASVTTRGQYYPTGHTPKPGEPAKLHILVEGPQSAVQRAVDLFRDETLKSLAKIVDAAGKR